MTKSVNPNIALLHVKEVAVLVRVSNKTVRRWIAANELAVVRLGRNVRISEAELARFVAARTSKVTVDHNTE
jgi:excisionase family DNA binding protein